MKTGPIDLMAEVVTLFKDEDLIAFFQFEKAVKSGKPVPGLCKVARSKKSTGGMKYFSIDFIVDTANDEVRRQFESVLAPLAKPAAKALLRGIDSVVLEVGMGVGSDAYVKHVDLIMKGKGPEARSFVQSDLCPALIQVCGLKCEEPIWWEDLKGAGADGRHVSLMERLKGLFRP